jgi:hypothetical protein
MIASNSTCVACPANCGSCTLSFTGVAMCNSGACASGFARQVDGSCQPCSLLTFTNCVTCTDVSGGVSNCTACGAGFTLKSDASTCLSCASSLSQCSVCADYAVGCSQCASGYYLTANNQFCGINCYQCVTPGGCNSPAASEGDPTTVCAINNGYGCWSMRSYMTNGTIQNIRGCYQQTCTSSQQSENCITLGSGNTVGSSAYTKNCTKCCTGNSCNSALLTGVSQKGVPSANPASLLATIAAMVVAMAVAYRLD